MPAGRPTKYKKSFCKVAIELMELGASRIEVCAELGIGYDALLDYQTKHAEFSEAIKKGLILCQAWWEKQGRENIKETKFNTPLWSRNMGCRFRSSPLPWNEKIDIDLNTRTVVRQKKRFDGEDDEPNN